MRQRNIPSENHKFYVPVMSWHATKSSLLCLFCRPSWWTREYCQGKTNELLRRRARCNKRHTGAISFDALIEQLAQNERSVQIQSKWSTIPWFQTTLVSTTRFHNNVTFESFIFYLSFSASNVHNLQIQRTHNRSQWTSELFIPTNMELISHYWDREMIRNFSPMYVHLGNKYTK